MNGESTLFDTLFKWVLGLGGTIIGGVTLASGKAIITQNREIGELKAGKVATDDAVTQLRGWVESTNDKFDRLDSKVDRVLEHLIKGKS